MFCSTIIPTIGRSSLPHAVESVLNQRPGSDDFEVIVINDSGRPLPQGPWQQSPRVRMVDTNRRNRSVARNVGAALARGQYFHFLDDDDWLLPGALAALRRAAEQNDAAWICGGFHLVDNQGQLIARIRPRLPGNCFVQLVASEWVPLQASLIASAAFFTVGGFAPLSLLQGGYEDIDLSRQFSYRYQFSTVTDEVAAIRSGDVGSTTDYANLLKQNRQSRERALSLPGALTRLQNSAKSVGGESAYWRGRITYYYLASARWNWRDRAVARSGSRTVYALASLLLAGRQVFRTSFWQAMRTPHINQVREAIEQRGYALYTNTRILD
jgi:glycosyltransferase involved in cell wall biosynthesis